MMNTRLESLELPSGKVYRDVEITGIDNTGMSIKHETGIARIVVAHLPASMRRDLDLNLEEAEAALSKEKMARAERFAKIEKAAAKRKKAAESTAARAEAPNIPVLQQKVTLIRTKREAALREASTARSNDLNSSRRSGPDGLETWSERASRMEKQAIRYASQIQALEEMIRRALVAEAAERSEE